ncbi:MAG: hypothetical protein KDD48_00660 [Bdellovibrionales bacterium]|nr:hypothetical protein [Bdellovibrionales bacterium]
MADRTYNAYLLKKVMIRFIFALILQTFSFGLSFADQDISAAAYGFQFSVSSKLCTKIVTEVAPWQKMETASDHPASLFPEHTYFKLAGPYFEYYETIRRKGLITFPPEVHFYTISAFEEVYAPEPKYIAKMKKDVARFKKLLSKRKPNPKYVQDTLFMAYPMGNISQTFLAQVHKVKFRSGEGIAFLTQLNIEPSPFRAEQLIYVFQGLSKDSKYLITATFPIQPKKELSLEEKNQNFTEQYLNHPDAFLKYLERVGTKIDQISADSFTPSLRTLDKWIKSIDIL